MNEKEWHHPSSIRFSREQVKWLIYHLPTLRNGSYPRNPKETGYTDAGISQRQFRRGAKFETPAIIAAELDVRIQRAGVDGLMLEFLYSGDYADELFVIEHMAIMLGVDRREIARRIQNALRYVSGNGRKKTSYKEYTRKLKKRV